jgi:hypothetical protein
MAGVVGNVFDRSTEGDKMPNTPDMQVATGALRGDWDHASSFWATGLFRTSYISSTTTTAGTTGNPTNQPDIISAYRYAIPEVGEGEVWGIYGDHPSLPHASAYYVPAPATLAGSYRCPWPRHGTRRTHIYFIPGDLDDTASNAVGDVMFDDGDGTTLEGLWEHDGTAFRKLIPQSGHDADVTSTTATLGGIAGPGAGPTAAAQVGWVAVKIDDGTAGGRTGWFPYWQ